MQGSTAARWQVEDDAVHKHCCVSCLQSLRQVFDTSGKGSKRVMVAGASVTSGRLHRNNLFRVTRDGKVVAEGLRAASMRRFKDSVKEVAKGKVRRAET